MASTPYISSCREQNKCWKRKKSTGSFRGRVNQQCFPLSVSNCSPGLVHCQHMHTPTAGYQSTDTTGRAGSTAFSQTASKTRILPKRLVCRPSFSFVKQSFFQLVQYQSRKANIKQNTCGKQIKKFKQETPPCCMMIRDMKINMDVMRATA